MRRIFFICILLFVFQSSNAQGLLARAEDDPNYFPVPANNIVAIIGAFETEVELLKNKIENKNEQVIEGIHFYTGTLNGKQIVLTRAGIGKVNAAITTTLLLEHFHPKDILFSGIAGAMNPALHAGDIVVAKQLAYHDYGRLNPDGLEKWGTLNPYNFNRNPIYFPCDSVLIATAQMAAHKTNLKNINDQKPQIFFGTIVTGDVFLADSKKNKAIREAYHADATEMEGAAVAQVCYQQRVPFLIIRSLSDSADDSAALDFVKYGKMAAENSAALVLSILLLMQ